MAINGTCEATPTRPQNSYPIWARGQEGFNIGSVRRLFLFWGEQEGQSASGAVKGEGGPVSFGVGSVRRLFLFEGQSASGAVKGEGGPVSFGVGSVRRLFLF